MKCAKCGSAHCCKDGSVKGRQRYKCKECGYHYSVQRKSEVKSVGVRKRALQLYLERVQPNWQIAVGQPCPRILLGEQVVA